MDEILKLIQELNIIEDKYKPSRYYRITLYMDLCGRIEIGDETIFLFGDLDELKEELSGLVEELKKE